MARKNKNFILNENVYNIVYKIYIVTYYTFIYRQLYIICYLITLYNNIYIVYKYVYKKIKIKKVKKESKQRKSNIR
jgi:hypothetical protein